MTRSPVEAVLITMSGVADCAVFEVPGPGNGVELLAAVEVSDGTLTAEQVQGWLRERVAEVDVPRRIVFYATLPREDTGEVASQRLRAAYWSAPSASSAL